MVASTTCKCILGAVRCCRLHVAAAFLAVSRAQGSPFWPGVVGARLRRGADNRASSIRRKAKPGGALQAASRRSAPTRDGAATHVQRWQHLSLSSRSLCIRCAYSPCERAAVAITAMRVYRHLRSGSLTNSPMMSGESIPRVFIQWPIAPSAVCGGFDTQAWPTLIP